METRSFEIVLIINIIDISQMNKMAFGYNFNESKLPGKLYLKCECNYAKLPEVTYDAILI